MGNRARYDTPPKSSANEWLRRALDHAGKSHVWLADELNKFGGLGMTYSRSTVGAMTRDRTISLEEGVVISLLTDYPVPYPGVDDPTAHLLALFRQVSPTDRLRLLATMMQEVADVPRIGDTSENQAS